MTGNVIFLVWCDPLAVFRSDTEVGVAGWQTESEDDSMEQLNQIGPFPAKAHQSFGIASPKPFATQESLQLNFCQFRTSSNFHM